MYVTVTRTKGSPEQPVEVATIAGEEMLPWLREIDGFDGLLMLTNQAAGTTFVLSFWESQEIAERHEAARMEFRDRVTSAVEVEVVETLGFDVSFAHLGPMLTSMQQ